MPSHFNSEDIFKKYTTSSKGLTSAEVERRRGVYGWNRISEKQKSLILIVLKYFWGPIPWMIEIAAILSLLIEHYMDFCLIAVLLLFNGFIAFWQEHQAANAIEALKKQLALKCRVLRDGAWKILSADSLVPGDIIKLRLGDIIPADAIGVDGEYLTINQSALTGESLSVTKGAGELLYSGAIINQGEMIAVVVATGEKTYFGHTMKLVESAGARSRFQESILLIGRYLICLCVALIVGLFVVQILKGDSPLHFLKFALILLVASIPVAMPAVLSMAMAVGALKLSHSGAIVTRLESIEELAGIDVLCCDKTGTLTRNELTIGEVVCSEGIQREDLLFYAATASKNEDFDSIDDVIIKGLGDPSRLEGLVTSEYTPFDPKRKRTEARVNAPGGESYRTSKGAPQVILELCGLDGDERNQWQAQISAQASRGERSIGVAKTDAGGVWKFLGLISIHDQLREDSVESIQKAVEHGLEIKMLTGDNLAIAKEISKQLKIGEEIYSAEIFKKSPHPNSPEEKRLGELIEGASGFAEVMPENKFWIVSELQKRGHIVEMTGDGVNDSPALRQADVGIAVSGATDAAGAAASLVLTSAGLGVIITAIEQARCIFQRMNTYAVYRIAETTRIILFVALTMVIYDLYPITAPMLILLALMNDIPIMTIAYDHTILPLRPIRWNMRNVLLMASVLGCVGVFETLLILYISLQYFQLGMEQLQTVIFLKLLLAGHLTLFVVRSEKAFWTPPLPARPLIFAVLATQLIGSLFAGLGIIVTAIPWLYIAGVWGYCLLWLFIEDGVKRATRRILLREGVA